MPGTLPTSADLHVNGVLTDFAMLYGQQMSDFVGDSAATVQRVDKQSDIYPVWSKADIHRDEMELRADGTESVEFGVRLDTSNTYYSHVYALKTKLTDRQRAQAKNEIDAEKAKVRTLMGKTKLKRDKLYAAAAFATGLWTANTEQTGVASDTPGANQFERFDRTGSDPLGTIGTQRQVVQLSCGYEPNVAVMNPLTLFHLANHADIKDLYKHTNGGPVSKDLVAKAIGVEKILVGAAIENTANEGAAASMSRVFGNHILLAYINPNPGDDGITAVTGFAWSEFDQVDENGAAIFSWYEKAVKSTYFEAEQAIDYAITCNDCGVFLLDAIS
jgi:hypothetical protein